MNSDKNKFPEIIHILEKGENSGVEFKSGDVKPENLAREFVSFANSNGGVILLGVEDDRKISGLQDEKNWEEWVMNFCRQNHQCLRTQGLFYSILH